MVSGIFVFELALSGESRDLTFANAILHAAMPETDAHPMLANAW